LVSKKKPPLEGALIGEGIWVKKGIGIEIVGPLAGYLH